MYQWHGYSVKSCVWCLFKQKPAIFQATPPPPPVWIQACVSVKENTWGICIILNTWKPKSASYIAKRVLCFIMKMFISGSEFSEEEDKLTVVGSRQCAVPGTGQVCLWLIFTPLLARAWAFPVRRTEVVRTPHPSVLCEPCGFYLKTVRLRQFSFLFLTSHLFFWLLCPLGIWVPLINFNETLDVFTIQKYHILFHLDEWKVERKKKPS